MGQRNAKRSSGPVRLTRGDSRPVMEAVESRLLMSYSPAGGDSIVNTYTTGTQLANASGNAVATDALGNYVVTWTSDGQDGSGSGIYARAFKADGTPRTGEFRVNQATAGSQSYAAVAMEANGDFAVVWSGPYTPPKSRTSYTSVFVRRFDAAAQPLGGEVLVSAGNSVDDYPTVAMDQDGDFVVAWQGDDPAINPKTSGGWGILAQRFDKNGQKAGSPLRVNSYVPNNQQMPRVAMDAAGSTFVVTWSSLYQDGAAGRGVYAKRYGVGADGSLAAGAEFKVNTAPTGGSTLMPLPFVAVRPDGGQFTIGWRAEGAEVTGKDTYARRYGSAGQPLSASEFRVNTTTLGDQNGTEAAYDGAGNSVITWSDVTAGNAVAQAYDVQGNPDGGEIVLNGTTAGSGYGGHVAFQPGVGFVAVFHNRVNGAYDDVFARRFVRNAAPSTAAEPAFGDTAIADPAGSTDGSDASAVVDLAAA